MPLYLPLWPIGTRAILFQLYCWYLDQNWNLMLYFSSFFSVYYINKQFSTFSSCILFLIALSDLVIFGSSLVYLHWYYAHPNLSLFILIHNPLCSKPSSTSFLIIHHNFFITHPYSYPFSFVSIHLLTNPQSSTYSTIIFVNLR